MTTRGPRRSASPADEPKGERERIQDRKTTTDICRLLALLLLLLRVAAIAAVANARGCLDSCHAAGSQRRNACLALPDESSATRPNANLSIGSQSIGRGKARERGQIPTVDKGANQIGACSCSCFCRSACNLLFPLCLPIWMQVMVFLSFLSLFCLPQRSSSESQCTQDLQFAARCARAKWQVSLPPPLAAWG